MRKLILLALLALASTAHAQLVPDYLRRPTSVCSSSTKFIQSMTAGAPTVCNQPSDVTGNAATATALAANPSDCSAGQYANAIAASGNLTCAQVSYSQVSSAPTVSGTATQVPYFTGSSTLASEAPLSYDAANDTLYGIYQSLGNGGYGNIWANPNGTDGDAPISTQHILEITNDPALGTGHPQLGLKSYGTGSGAYVPTLTGMRYRGSQASPSAIQSGDSMLILGARGSDDSDLFAVSAQFACTATENFASSGDHHGTKCTLETLGNGQTWPRTERLQIGPGASPAITVTGDASISGKTTTNSLVLRGAGSANPSSPSTNDVFYRTDSNIGWILYDGTRWLTQNQFQLFGGQQGTQGTTTQNGLALTYVATSDYGIYLTRCDVTTRVSTTNNGSNKYAITFFGTKADQSSNTTIFTIDTGSDTASTFVNHNQTINATLDSFGSGSLILQMSNSTKTGSPGALNVFASCYMRKIIT